MRGQSDDQCHRAAFPEIPDALLERFSIEELSLRSFGLYARDLEIDFDLTSRPVLETQIVRCCTGAKGPAQAIEDFFWELEVSTRTRCLLIIAALGERGEHLTLDFRCPDPACRQEMEVEFSVADLADMQPGKAPNELINVCIGKEEINFRRPAGKDQLDWQSQSFTDERAAIQYMVKTLVVGSLPEALQEKGGLDDNWVQAIGAALTAADPLANFVVRTICPDCGRENIHSLDLGALALEKLRHNQDCLLGTIHALASRYHWTEKQILTIPLWRRLHYLALIEKEETR